MLENHPQFYGGAETALIKGLFVGVEVLHQGQ